jgi:hypothetical protein
MTETRRTSALPFVILVTLVLLIGGYLGWRVYNAPVDEGEAGLVGMRATEVVVRAGGGDASVCETMREVSAPDEVDGVISRCQEIAGGALGRVGALDVSGLRATEVDVDRNSGTVTVAGTLQAPGQALPLTFVWPVGRSDDAWVISGAPEVDVD